MCGLRTEAATPVEVGEQAGFDPDDYLRERYATQGIARFAAGTPAAARSVSSPAGRPRTYSSATRRSASGGRSVRAAATASRS